MAYAIEVITQMLVIVFVTHAAIYSYKIGKWSCASSVHWLTAGFIYILVWRISFFILHLHEGHVRTWVEQSQSYFILPVWAMWAWGLYLLYKTLANLGK